MLTPSWPSRIPNRRDRPTAAVRRRVDIAQRRILRRSVTYGGALVAVLLLVDLTISVALDSDGVEALAPFSIGAATMAAFFAMTARRTPVRPEPLAAAIFLLVVGVALMGLVLTPTEAPLVAAAQLATVTVGAGLFLPWSPRWHTGVLIASQTLAVGFMLSPLGMMLDVTARSGIVIGTTMATITSGIGHWLWQSRFRSMLQQQFILRQLSRYAQRQEAYVRELNRELNRVARRDSLTGVGNRLAFDEAIAGLLFQGDRLRPARFALVLFDIDQFKDYNDAHGHLAGDAALVRLGEILRQVTREDDRAFRYGGEEFLLLLPDVDLTGALSVAERLRQAVADDESTIPRFTISCGVALCDPADGRDPEPLLRRADAALYLAKNGGRNRVCSDELSVAMQREALASAS
ncbi:MAG TPA: GGDEF domain-containing protein [Candidatus Limnocylindria bacterium]|nr:GGDEF domain-containing protein [Candidatus Limnocylindria bacterium]